MIKTQGIPHYRIGRLIRFKEEEIDEWLMTRKEAAAKLPNKRLRLTIPDIHAVAQKAVRKAIDNHNPLAHNRVGKSNQIKGLGRKEA
jgi:hypothetical protein